MCGIVGIVHRDPEHPVDRARVQCMVDRIRHRGPDEEGLWCQGSTGLAMRRLSIIDLAGGHQPIFNEDGSKLIVFNGEIYNYRGLRDGLLARGHRFRTNSDTETILHLYEEKGPGCAAHLRGMFAFAIWDQAQRRLVLARDRFGIKPLYLVEGPWGLAFSSELKALVAAGLTERSMDWSAIDMFFELGYIPAPATPFRDVRKLEPGHTLVWEAGASVKTCYWDLPRESKRPPEDPGRAVLDALDDSVAAHLVSDVPVAAFLSGGLDSSAVVASMALQGGPPHAFTARYHGSGAAAADETQLARLLTERYGARLTVVDIEPKVDDIFEAIVAALDEPHADDSAIPTWFLSEAVGREYKVALTGIGGDELFAGYRRHLGLLAGAWYSKVPRSLRRAASALALRLPEPTDSSLGVDRVKRFLRSGDGDAAARFLAMISRIRDEERMALYGPALREELDGGAAAAHFDQVYRGGGSPQGLAAGLYLDYKTFLPDDILALSDRLAMAHSLEIRVPFVDHELVETVFPWPQATRIGPWRPKHLLRQALRSRLPEEILTAPKRGFVGPTAAWLRHELRPLLEDELAPSRMETLGYFQPEAVRGLLEDHFARRQNREGILWALLCFSVWHRVYVEEAASVAWP